MSKYCHLSVLNQTRNKAISIDKNFMAITTLSPQKLHVSCLSDSYPFSLRNPFDIMYMPNGCEASLDSFFLPSNDKLTQEVDSRKFIIKFVDFKRKYEKLTDFTWMQTFNLSALSNNELDSFASKIWELKRVSFQQVKEGLKQIDRNYLLVIPKWLLIFITRNYCISNINKHNLVNKVL